MNKTAIKNYAIWARVQLIESAKQRAFEYAITDGENDPNLEIINGRILSSEEKNQRAELISLIKQKGFEQVMEEAAYTWFNRFIALRFMEVNGYLPSKVRVFTDENNEFKPQILKEAMTVELEGLDRDKILGLIEKQDNEELFKDLIIAQCNSLSDGLPYVFEKVANWTELLFPDNLLRNDSVIGRLISDIDVDDWADEVEIIGWLYQYYISEKHEEVIDPLHGKTIKKEDIPAATQLFTTDWVVRYILDNSLGRYWIERHPESRLAEKLTYFVVPKSGEIPMIDEAIMPEELKVLDPCVGSGHFLSYAFDILIEIYRECGWSDRDAAKSIIESNLYGLDIDNRAAQLACFAVMMKARKYNRRIISEDTHLNIMAMQDSTDISDELINYISKHDQSIKSDLNELRLIFNNAKEYGSIIEVPEIDYKALYNRFNQIKSEGSLDVTEIPLVAAMEEQMFPLIQQAEILSLKYDVVATNPPYMNRYSARLKAYISEKYEAYKGDLFSVFIYRNFSFCKLNGYSGLMTPMVWMFIKTYEPLRTFIIGQKSITTLIQFEYSAFEEATVPICSFVLRNGSELINGQYFKLSNFRGGMEVQRIKTEEAILNKQCGFYFESDESDFSKIPGSPIAYWVSKNVFAAFRKGKMEQICIPRMGLTTGQNEKYLRLWHEVNIDNIGFKCDRETAKGSGRKWFPYNKAGDYRKWYGNRSYIVNWKNDGYELQNTMHPDGHRIWAHNFNLEFNFKEHLSWNDITSGDSSFRIYENGFLFDAAAAVVFVPVNKIKKILGFLNTNFTNELTKILNPTIHFKLGDFCNLPYEDWDNTSIDDLVECNIQNCRADWDSFETSWDFKKHPLI